jgi:ubiquinone biosynthesis protein UbiJ
VLDGAAHSLHVRVAGHGIELPNSPVTFGPLQLGALADEILLLREQVARLSVRVEQTVAPDGRFQAELIRMLADRVAALGDIQIEMVAREMDALRALHRAALSPAPDVAEAA